MKYILISLILTAKAYAQDSTRLLTVGAGEYDYSMGEIGGNDFMNFKNGVVVSITGDPLKIINSLQKQVNKVFHKEGELYQTIQASVDFTNKLPEYFKTGPLWLKYCRQLRKQGYKTIKK